MKDKRIHAMNAAPCLQIHVISEDISYLCMKGRNTVVTHAPIRLLIRETKLDISRSYMREKDTPVVYVTTRQQGEQL